MSKKAETDPEKIAARFWCRVNKDGPVVRPELTCCWEWTGHKMKNGYGHHNPHGLAHRWSWQINRGPIPDGKQVLHVCDNPGCVNPEHLWVGSINDNMQDKIKKGRQVRGETQATHKLTEEQVREIRTRYFSWGKTNTMPVLAREYGVSVTQIYRVVHSQHWRHVCL